MSARGRLWLVTRKYPPAVGGMERHAHGLASGLARERPITLVKWGRGQGGLPLFLPWAALRLAVGLVRRRVSVLLLGDAVLAAFGRLADAFGVPVVIAVHGLDLTWPRPLYQAYLRRFLDGPRRHFVANSRHVCDLLVARGIAREAITIIPIGVDPAAEAELVSPRERPPTLLFIGRLVPRKGIVWFVESVLPILSARCPGVRLVVAGDGPSRAALLRAASANPGVEWRGAVTEPDKWRLLAACDAVVMPNLPRPGDPEGFGVVALEAGAAGRMVFVADVEGLQDAVTEGCNGHRLPPADAKAWSDALARALADRGGLRDQGRAAREFVMQRFSWTAIARRYGAVVDDLAART